MNRKMTSLLALGVGAAAYAMNMKKGRMGRMSMMDVQDIWSSKYVKRLRKRIARAIY